MRRSPLRFAPLLLLLAAVARVRAEDAPVSDPLAGFSGARAKEFAAEFASDAMGGRKTGLAGGAAAEAWLAQRAEDLRLAPMGADGTWFQSFPIRTGEVLPPILLEADGAPLEYGKDFVDLIYTGAGRAEAEVVFVGYGIVAPDRGWDDYAGTDVKGKAVLALRGAPASREAEFSVERQIGWKSAQAADRGAVAFLIAEGANAVPGTIQDAFHRPGLPAVWVTGAVADRLLSKAGRTMADLKASRDAGDPGKSFATGSRVKVEVNGRFLPDAVGRNVLAAIPGTDPALRDEAVMLCAHADHLGTDATGRVYNGADDNGSGSVVLLALAEALARSGWAPRRTVVFAWLAAEEQGLVGSQRLASAPPFPHRLVAVVNADMVGRGQPEIGLGGGDAWPAHFDRFVAAQPQAERARIHPFRTEGNSDHWAFHERGVPALFVVSRGDHPDYHRVTDDPESLQPEVLEAAGRFLGRALVAIADAPGPLLSPRDAVGIVLREGPRAVEGPSSAAALGSLLAAAKDAPAAEARTALVRAGHAAVVVPLDEAADGGQGLAVAWGRLSAALRAREKEAVLVRSASDLLNAPRAGRIAVLPRVHLAASARRFPGVLQVARDLGARWVAPFDPGAPPDDATRDRILDAALSAGLVVDLTGLPPEGIAAAVGRSDRLVATLRRSVPWAEDPAAAADALAEARRQLGPRVLLVLAGGAERPLLDAGPKVPLDAKLAPVAVVEEDTDRLADALMPGGHGGDAPWRDPGGGDRARLRAAFGRALVDLLRRLP